MGSLCTIPTLQGTLMTDQQILDAIQEIRAKNNVLHVGIQRIALESAPDRTRTLLRQIVDNDRHITDLSELLANNENR